MMDESEPRTGTHPEEAGHPLTPQEAKDIFFAFCDGEVETLEEEAAEIEGWRTEVQSGTNRRRSHELKSLQRRITQIKSLRRYAEGLFDRIPATKTNEKDQ